MTITERRQPNDNGAGANGDSYTTVRNSRVTLDACRAASISLGSVVGRSERCNVRSTNNPRTIRSTSHRATVTQIKARTKPTRLIVSTPGSFMNRCGESHDSACRTIRVGAPRCDPRIFCSSLDLPRDSLIAICLLDSRASTDATGSTEAAGADDCASSPTALCDGATVSGMMPNPYIPAIQIVSGLMTIKQSATHNSP